jgi:hypothetical protein
LRGTHASGRAKDNRHHLCTTDEPKTIGGKSKKGKPPLNSMQPTAARLYRAASRRKLIMLPMLAVATPSAEAASLLARSAARLQRCRWRRPCGPAARSTREDGA